MAPQALHDLIEKWRRDAERHAKHGDCYRRGQGWGLTDCADELAALLAPRPEQEKEDEAAVDVQLLAWAVSNCHTLAQRRLHALDKVGCSQPLAFLNQEREFWGHVLRICEKAGARSQGVLRASLPTELTEGAAPRPGAEQADEEG